MEYEKKIDLKRRKPRQGRGTKAYWWANRIGLGGVAFAVVLGAAFVFMPNKNNFREKYFKINERITEEQKRRRLELHSPLGRSLTIEELEQLREKSKDPNEEFDGFTGAK